MQCSKDMDHLKIRTDNNHSDDDPIVNPRSNHSPLISHDYQSNIKTEDQMQSIIKMEVYPEFSTMIEFDNEAVPKLEPFVEMSMSAEEFNDDDCYNDNDINEMSLQEEGPQSGTVADCEFHRQSCPYCAFVSICDSVYVATYSKELHLVRYHPEHYFPDERIKARAAGMALEDFQRILVDAILSKYILKAGTMTSCSFCSREYRSRSFAGNRQMMQKHLLYTHLKKLKKALQPILKRKIRTLEKKRAKSIGNDAMGTEHLTSNFHFASESCLPTPASTNSSRNTSRNWMLTSHSPSIKSESKGIDDESETLIETKSIFSSEFENEDSNHDPLGETEIDGTHRHEDPSTESRPNCTYCGFEFLHGNAARLPDFIEMHHVRYHPEHYFPEEKDRAVHGCGWKLEEFQKHLIDNLLPKFVFKSGKFKWSCSLCPKKKMHTKSDRYRVQRHLIFTHNLEMKRQIRMSIKKSPIQGKKISKTKKTASHSKDSFVSDFVSCLRPKGISRCSHCGIPCTKKKLKDHRMQFQPGHYFRKEQEKASALGFQPEQFQHILKNSLFLQFVIRAGIVRNCSLCDVYFTGKKSGSDSSRVTMQKHLIDTHKLELRERLEIILEGTKGKEAQAGGNILE